MAGFPRLMQKVVSLLERLPGVGPKSATRLAFYLMTSPASFSKELCEVILEMKEKIKFCRRCFHISEEEECEICRDGARLDSLLCVVERPVDVLSIEAIGSYRGRYHVLGGALNPLDHVGPEELKIVELIDRVGEIISRGGVLEIILATNPTMEGEATALYIKKKLEHFGEKIIISRIGSGLPMGGDLEFADVATLDRAMSGRRGW